MSTAEENVELITSAWRELVETGNVPLDVVHPDVEWGTQLETYHGHEGVREWQRSIVSILGGIDIEMTGVEAVGDDKVVSEVEIKGQAQMTGIEGAVRAATVWTIRDGLLIRVESFSTREEAMRAARS